VNLWGSILVELLLQEGECQMEDCFEKYSENNYDVMYGKICNNTVCRSIDILSLMYHDTVIYCSMFKHWYMLLFKENK